MKWRSLMWSRSFCFAAVLAASAILLVVSSEDGSAQTNALSHSPAEVVQKYFVLDNKGARLDAGSFQALAPYVDWKEEPVWGKVVVITGFSVPDDYRKWEIVNPLEVVIPVEFKTMGAVYFDTAGFVTDKTIERVRVRVKVANSRWKIVEPILPPHVGQRRMMNFVRQAMLEETDETRRIGLELLHKELRKAK